MWGRITTSRESPSSILWIWTSLLVALTRHPTYWSVEPGYGALVVSQSPRFLARNEHVDEVISPLRIPSLLGEGSYHHLCPVHVYKDYVERTAEAPRNHLFVNSRSGNPLLPRALALLLWSVIEDTDPSHINSYIEWAPVANEDYG